MNSSFYNSISGVKSFQFAMDVQSNNIANISTVGFKGSSPEISSLFQQHWLEPMLLTLMMMVWVQAVQTTAFNMTQGILQTTDNPFDLALGNEGWFGVQGLDGKTYYTRAGQFSVDGNGDLVDLNGNYLLATSGNNMTPTTLDQETLSKFGTYYNSSSTTSVTPYAVAATDDVALGSVGSQTKIHLPDLLYYPPTPTTKATYAANLNPQVITDAVTVPLSSNDYISNVTVNSGKVSLNGTTNNTTELLNPQEGNSVFVTFTDINGKKIQISTQLNSSKEWSLSNVDVSSLDTSNDLTASVAVVSKQEVANTEHAAISIIAPNGDKDTLDMTFTKRVPFKFFWECMGYYCEYL